MRGGIDEQFAVCKCFIRNMMLKDDWGVSECGDDELIVNWPWVSSRMRMIRKHTYLRSYLCSMPVPGHPRSYGQPTGTQLKVCEEPGETVAVLQSAIRVMLRNCTTYL